ncbi:hypothetical protein [Proteus sp. PR00224]|uniref:hypothetical protein n=1 Tax=Proteus sp. PR00224 TaxID=2794026 RepID=UPI0018E438CF|nr:hypothetical protein [Proteus sp. PR00224]MBI6340449.1 hypothetical protein [Proteus sp. PR00224]
MDKSRQQFEEFIKFHLGDKVDENTFETANNGLNYSYPYVDLMWITWQASRESLINGLEPVGWMYPVFQDDKMRFTTDAVASENIDIHFQSHGSPLKVTPLYRLDK